MKEPEVATRRARLGVVGPLGTNPLHGEPEDVLRGDRELTLVAEVSAGLLSERGFFAREDENGRYENTDCKYHASN